VRIKSSCAANFAAARLAQALEIISPFFFSLSSGRLLKTFKRRKTKDEMDEDAHIFRNFYFSIRSFEFLFFVAQCSLGFSHFFF
jgi:hypothetical protein